MSISICSFYTFVSLSDAQLRSGMRLLSTTAQQQSVRGLFVVALEGLNATIAGERIACERFLQVVEGWAGVPIADRKWSEAEALPFRKFKYDIRKDIIDCGAEPVPPTFDSESLLSPEEFHARLQNKDVVVLDTRNTYESALGTFAGAICPPIDVFSEFPQYVAKSELDREREVLIFCTGGIRCEKALTVLRREGFRNVHQLQGGILRYLERYGAQGAFKGECFVFDDRVAVDGALRPSQQFHFCRRCGDPTSVVHTCPICVANVPLCRACIDARRACSRRCEQGKQDAKSVGQ